MMYVFDWTHTNDDTSPTSDRSTLTYHDLFLVLHLQLEYCLQSE